VFLSLFDYRKKNCGLCLLTCVLVQVGNTRGLLSLFVYRKKMFIVLCILCKIDYSNLLFCNCRETQGNFVII